MSNSGRLSLSLPSVRLSSSLFVLTSVGLLILLLSTVLTNFLGGIVAIFASLFLWQWFLVHGRCLCRSQRALFHEANILETYQPRARTEGHLFDPEPPTPVPDEMRSQEQREKFRQMRDAYYADEFTKIQRLNQESKDSGKSSSSGHSHSHGQSYNEGEVIHIEMRDEGSSNDSDDIEDI